MHCSETLGGIVPRFQCDAGGSSSGGSGAPAPTSETAVLVKQAQQLNSEGKQDEAVTTYRKGLEISPNDVDAHLGMGSVLDLKGDYAEARRHLAKGAKRLNLRKFWQVKSWSNSLC